MNVQIGDRRVVVDLTDADARALGFPVYGGMARAAAALRVIDALGIRVDRVPLWNYGKRGIANRGFRVAFLRKVD